MFAEIGRQFHPVRDPSISIGLDKAGVCVLKDYVQPVVKEDSHNVKEQLEPSDTLEVPIAARHNRGVANNARGSTKDTALS